MLEAWTCVRLQLGRHYANGRGNATRLLLQKNGSPLKDRIDAKCLVAPECIAAHSSIEIYIHSHSIKRNLLSRHVG